MKSYSLTPAESEVLLLLVKGLSNKDIADKLCRTIKAVKWRLTRLYKKLGVKTRLQAVAKYHNYGKALPKR